MLIGCGFVKDAQHLFLKSLSKASRMQPQKPTI
jgi:hypothetical protein